LRDGSWLVGEGSSSNGNHQVRMNVITPPGQDEWKNVEITGYVKVIDAASDDNNAASSSISISESAFGDVVLVTSSAPVVG
jgi:hypothetical protein